MTVTAGVTEALERALRDRLDRLAGAGGDRRAVEAEDRRDVELDTAPLVLLGAGSVAARPFVAHALARFGVAALVDNARAGAAEGGRPILDDAGLRALLAREAGAVGVMCCGSDAAVDHFRALWEPSGRPLLSLAEANRRAGLADPDQIGSAGAIAALLDRADLWRAFADEESRRCFLSVLLYRLTWDARWLEPCRLPYGSMYFFTDALAPGPDEVLVDGGAFDGDTAAAFVRATGGTHRHIHAFEADRANLAALHARLAGVERVTVHPVGLWSHTDTLRFADGGGPGSRLGEEGGTDVPVRAIDSLDLGPVTLIKLDIEGAEIPALRGAAATIARHRPRLAIAVYHEPSDLAAIPDLIAALRPGSRFRLRHHSPLHCDTVLYVE